MMHATRTVNNVRFEAYSEALNTLTPSLNVCVEVGKVAIKTHTLPRVDVEARLRGVDLSVWQENGCVFVQAENSGAYLVATDGQRKAEILITAPVNCAMFAQVVTGSLHVRDLEAPTRTHVITGQTTLNDLQGPVHATSVTGSIHYGGRLTSGAHRFASTTGSVNLALVEPPDARVYAWATTGRVQCGWPLSAQRRGGYLTGDHLYGVAGSGEGRVIAEVVTGSVHLGAGGAGA